MPSLEVLILYEDYGTGLRAKRSLDLLPARFPAKAHWSTKLWRIELLSDPLLKEQAAREAAAADVLILSLHGRSTLPAGLREWLTCWLGHKPSRPCAMGVLLDAEQGGQGGKNPVIACIQQVAAIAGSDFFYGFSEAPGSELNAAMEEIDQRVNSSSSVLDEMLRRVEPSPVVGDQ